MASAYIRSASL